MSSTSGKSSFNIYFYPKGIDIMSSMQMKTKRYQTIYDIKVFTQTLQLMRLFCASIKVFTNAQYWQYWHYCQICIPIYFQFSSLSAPYHVSKCEIRCQGVYKNYFSKVADFISLLYILMALLTFLYCGEFVKTLMLKKKVSTQSRQKTQK